MKLRNHFVMWGLLAVGCVELVLLACMTLLRKRPENG